MRLDFAPMMIPAQDLLGPGRLPRDDHFLDFVVSSLWNDFPANQLILPGVWPSRHDLRGICVSDARQ